MYDISPSDLWLNRTDHGGTVAHALSGDRSPALHGLLSIMYHLQLWDRLLLWGRLLHACAVYTHGTCKCAAATRETSSIGHANVQQLERPQESLVVQGLLYTYQSSQVVSFPRLRVCQSGCMQGVCVCLLSEPAFDCCGSKTKVCWTRIKQREALLGDYQKSSIAHKDRSKLAAAA